MTAKLAMTNRQLLEQLVEQNKVRERDAATTLMLAHTVDRLIREKEILMGMLGRMMVERLTRQP